MFHEPRTSILPEAEVKPDGDVPTQPSNAILLVDDDPDIRSLTRTFLEHEGYRVYSSGDAIRAAQIFRSAPTIDLLIADVYLHERSGMELAQELKQLKRSLPVLMISGGSMDDEKLDLLRLESWSFLAKPFSLPALLSAVHEILKTNIRPSQRLV